MLVLLFRCRLVCSSLGSWTRHYGGYMYWLRRTAMVGPVRRATSLGGKLPQIFCGRLQCRANYCVLQSQCVSDVLGFMHCPTVPLAPLNKQMRTVSLL